MEEKKLNLDAPLLSVRRVPVKPEHSSESENTKKKTKTKTRKKVKELCQETEHETLVRLLLQDQSFDHVMEPSSVPFKWEQTPGKPKDHHYHHTLIEESDLIKALDIVSSTASFSVNCSISGVSDELEKNGERSGNVSKYDVIPEYRDLIMSRFIPDAKAMTTKQKKVKKQSIDLQRVSMAIDQEFNNDAADDDGTYDRAVSKKTVFGLCCKNSLDVFNPVLSPVKTCQNVGVKVNPKSLDFVSKTKSSTLATLPRILRSNKVISKSQEFHPIIPRFSSEVSKISLSKSGEIIRISRNPSRLQRTTSDQIQRQDTRFHAEEVRRRRNGDKIRSRNLSETSLVSVSQPPLPKTPSESWLCRTLPRNSAAASLVVSGQSAAVVSGQSASFKKIDQKTIKWETMVKTACKYHDHVRDSEELTGVHPSRQHKPETGILFQTEIPFLRYSSS